MSTALKLIDSIETATDRIQPIVRETPSHFSPYFSDLLDAEVWFKLENLQLTGSFKVRGAANKILSLIEFDSIKSVVTASTGNHGAAVAFASKKVNIPCTIFVPKDATPTKLNNMKQFGASIQFAGTDCIDAEAQAREESKKSHTTYISPYNDVHVVAGQGTLGLEMVQQCSELDVALISVGGGGLISGVGTALKNHWPKMKIMGCSPINSAVMLKSIEAGRVLDLESLPTLSDGTAGGVEEDSITFPMCQNMIDESIYVSEEEIKQAMVQYFEQEHQLIEGAAGTSIAALIQQKDKIKGKRVGVVICGGNIGLNTVKKILK